MFVSSTSTSRERGLRAAVLIAAALAVFSFVLAAAPIQWPLDDFAEYWAAGRLNASGANPYEHAAMLEQQRQIGWAQANPDMMYNPPWTLALAMPMGAMTFQVARAIWLPVQIFATLWSAATLWILYGGTRIHIARACGLALVWMPTLIALRMGQLSPIILLGLVGFLWALSSRRDFAAGVFFSLTAVKPQLVALVWVAFALWGIVDRRWRVLAGATACIAAASLVAMWPNPGIFGEYHHLMASAPPTLEFESPNLATLLRLTIGTAGSWPQFVPTGLGAAVVGLMWYQRRAEWDWPSQLPGLVMISCLLTSYGGWAFDLVVLLVPIVATAAIVARSGRQALVAAGAALFGTISCGAFAMHAAHVPQAAFLWMTPAVALATCWLQRLAAPRRHGDTEKNRHGVTETQSNSRIWPQSHRATEPLP
jgi:hypothetical protein